MPEVDIFFTAADIREIANLLFQQGAFIVPNLEYETEEISILRDAQEFERHCREHGPGLLFGVSPEWQRTELMVKSVIRKFDGRKIYYVSQVDSGPRLEIYCPPVVDLGGEPAIQAGAIAYKPRFWNPSTQEMEPAPSALAECYKNLRRHFLRHGEVMKLKVRSYIVTKSAKENGGRLKLPQPLDAETLKKMREE